MLVCACESGKYTVFQKKKCWCLGMLDLGNSTMFNGSYIVCLRVGMWYTFGQGIISYLLSSEIVLQVQVAMQLDFMPLFGTTYFSSFKHKYHATNTVSQQLKSETNVGMN